MVWRAGDSLPHMYVAIVLECMQILTALFFPIAQSQ